MNHWIVQLDEGPADGPRLAVKDAIDVAGTVSTAGCQALADRGLVAADDAPCVATARAAGARLVGKTNLHELCFGTTGLNPTFGDPVNPRWPELVPGGSSSGSAVAVALDEADVAYGTDTGGSVRIPAACCGIAGLKTTHGRVSIEGVWPLSPSLDTVGPLARDVAGSPRRHAAVGNRLFGRRRGGRHRHRPPDLARRRGGRPGASATPSMTRWCVPR